MASSPPPPPPAAAVHDLLVDGGITIVDPSSGGGGNGGGGGVLDADIGAGIGIGIGEAGMGGMPDLPPPPPLPLPPPFDPHHQQQQQQQQYDGLGQAQGQEGYGHGHGHGHGHGTEAAAAAAAEHYNPQQQWEYAVQTHDDDNNNSSHHQQQQQPQVQAQQQVQFAYPPPHEGQGQQQHQQVPVQRPPPYGHPVPEHHGASAAAAALLGQPPPQPQQQYHGHPPYGTDGTYQAQAHTQAQQGQYYQPVGSGEASHHHHQDQLQQHEQQYPADHAGRQQVQVQQPMQYHQLPAAEAHVQAQAQAHSHAYPHPTAREHAEAMAAASALRAAAAGGYGGGGDHHHHHGGNLYHGGGAAVAAATTTTAAAAGAAADDGRGVGGRRRGGGPSQQQPHHHRTPVPSDEAWERRFQELREFYRRFGHSDVPQTYAANKPLGKWVGKQREKWKIRQETGSSTLTDERIRKLETVEFKLYLGKGQHAKVHGLYMTERKTEEFNQRFQELAQFRAQHGHCRVPFADPQYNSLAQWCSRFNRKLRSHQLTGPMAVAAPPPPGDDGATGVGTAGGNNGEGNSASTTEGGATTAKEKEMRVLLERKKKLEGLGFDFDYGFHRKDEVADGPKNNNDRWNEKFDALKQYKERVGNADVPSTYREGEAKKDASLATWVSKQREQWRNKQRGNKGRKISDEREEKLASLGFNFEVLDAMWDARYAELKQFHEKYGTTDVTEKTGSRSLWQWCKRQREAFRQFLQDQTGPMTNVRIAKMESVGFDWKYERTNEALEAKGSKAAGTTEKKTKGRVGRPKKKDAVSTDTGVTMETATEAAAASERATGGNAGGEMTQSEIEDIEAAIRDVMQRYGSQHDDDGRNNNDPAKWLAMFHQLIQYKKDHGHCRVPQREKEYDGLGLWVKVQRLEYRNLVDNKTGPGKVRLSQWRLELLQKIDFVFVAANPTSFEGRLEQLRAFKREFGHTKVPQNFQRNKSLGKWVSKTREQYRFKEEGKKCRLTEDHISQLDSIGFQWRVGRGKGRSSWDEYYQDLLNFHQEHGHFNVPINYAPNPSLASWANVQRSNYRSQVQNRNPKGKSVREQNQKLIELGFNFHVDPEGGAIVEEESPGRKRKHRFTTATADATKPSAKRTKTDDSDDQRGINTSGKDVREDINGLQGMDNEAIVEMADTIVGDV